MVRARRSRGAPARRVNLSGRVGMHVILFWALLLVVLPLTFAWWLGRRDRRPWD